MRRKYFGLAIAALVTLGHTAAFGGDQEIAQEIMTRLKSNRDTGALKDFSLDMRVEEGVVLFRGNVSQQDQKNLVLSAAKGVEGITKVVDEVVVKPAEAAPEVEAVAVKAESKQEAKPLATRRPGDSLRNMLSAGLDSKLVGKQKSTAVQPVTVARPESKVAQVAQVANTVDVKPAGAVELAAPAAASDQQLVAAVVGALSKANQAGTLRGFGVDVQANAGVVTLRGRAVSPEVAQQIAGIAQSIPGVQSIQPMIEVVGQPAPVHPVSLSQAGDQVPTMAAPPQAAPMPAAAGPVPVAYSAGAPQYEAPNLPNYAWPGYAAYPNYAAVTYPQQYSPCAWPYIGPFHPYPQVPLGWRKVCLEWDDGWWYLDFSSR